MAASVKCLVTNMIKANSIMVFSKSTCPFCLMAKSVLKDAGAKNMTVLEIENRPDAFDIQNALKDMTGSATVPAVFVAGKYLGGGTETQELFDTGKLKKLIEDVDTFIKKNDSS
ncbi:glutaredoxin-C8-like [Anneissia japonica]|uniref:glutaredoxin-C8-like n=1 Tax=Anneissia japonica TaxID=1529436 RepID=UPI0014257D4B|nr:glutaredoxin-C8-like [Anneissia japonica]